MYVRVPVCEVVCMRVLYFSVCVCQFHFALYDVKCV